MPDNRDPRKNSAGYNDPTAYKAIKNTEQYEQFKKLLHTIFFIVDAAGFEVEGRIALKDTKTGKVWR